MKQTKTRVNRKRITGQGMTEYIIVVALIAIAAIAAVGYFGGVIQQQFKNLGLKMSGDAAETVSIDKPTAKAADMGTYSE